MMPVEVTGDIEQRPYSFAAFACPEPGCGRFYNIIHGYFQVIEGRISEVDRTRQELCSKDGLLMYLDSADPGNGGSSVYKCSQFGCGNIKSVKGPITR
jgi:hypothetical protein